MRAIAYAAPVSFGASLCGCATSPQAPTPNSRSPDAAGRHGEGVHRIFDALRDQEDDPKEPFDATITLAGFKPRVAHVQSLVEGGGGAGAVGNAPVGGVVGIAVDATTDGAMDDLVPNPLHVDLEKDATQASAAPLVAR